MRVTRNVKRSVVGTVESAPIGIHVAVRRRDGDVDVVTDGETALAQRLHVVRAALTGHGRAHVAPAIAGSAWVRVDVGEGEACATASRLVVDLAHQAHHLLQRGVSPAFAQNHSVRRRIIGYRVVGSSLGSALCFEVRFRITAVFLNQPFQFHLPKSSSKSSPIF